MLYFHIVTIEDKTTNTTTKNVEKSKSSSTQVNFKDYLIEVKLK